MLHRVPRCVLLCLVLLSFVTACGGAASSGAGERPSKTASFSPTREHSTPTRTPPTRTPAGADTAAPTGNPPATSSASTAPSSSAEASVTPGAGDGEDESSVEDWWWVLIPILVATGIGLLLMRHARTRHAWESRLAIAERETGWFARDLIPQLRRSGSPAGVSGGWAVAAPRVAALDDRLSELISTAPGEGERARASALQGAVRTAPDHLVALVGAGDQRTQWAVDLDDAQAPLLEVLVASSTSGDGGTGAR
jgi:hypothetical protein